MTRFFRWILAFIGIRRETRWEDGIIVQDLTHYRTLYAATVAWVRVVRPNGVQAPEMYVTVRHYPIWPVSDGLIHYGKVLAPNVIKGDTGGTLCLYKGKEHPLDVNIIHEMKHAITGESGHPSDLFPVT